MVAKLLTVSREYSEGVLINIYKQLHVFRISLNKMFKKWSRWNAFDVYKKSFHSNYKNSSLQELCLPQIRDDMWQH